MTTQVDKGKWYRSKEITFSTGATEVVDPNFLTKALGEMAAPEIAEIIIRANGSITASGGTAENYDCHKLLSRVRFTDRAGELVNLPGSILKLVDQMEHQGSHVEPSDVADAATNAAYEFYTRLDFEPNFAWNPSDYRVPLNHWVNGGQLSLSFQTPSNFGTPTLTFTVYVRVVDNRFRDLKSRMTWKEYSVSNQEFDYPVGGSLRAAILTSDLTTTGYTDLSGFTEYDFRDLDLYRHPLAMLQEDYRRERPSTHSADQYLAATEGAVPLVVPYKGQHIGSMPNLETFHMRLNGAAPASGRIAICAIENRSGDLGVEWTGAASVGELASRIRSSGHIPGPKGSKKAMNFPAKLQRRLPIRFK